MISNSSTKFVILTFKLKLNVFFVFHFFLMHMTLVLLLYVPRKDSKIEQVWVLMLLNCHLILDSNTKFVIFGSTRF